MDIYDLFIEYPECISKRSKLKSIVMDILPQSLHAHERRVIGKAIMESYDLGIIKRLQQIDVIDNQFIENQATILTRHSEIEISSAKYAVEFWCKAYGEKVLHKRRRKQSENRHNKVYTKTSYPVVIDETLKLSTSMVKPIHNSLQQVQKNNPSQVRKNSPPKVKKKRLRKSKRLFSSLLIATAFAAVIMTGFYYGKVVKPAHIYSSAIELYNAGQYSEALTTFERIEDYQDSADYIYSCKENIANQVLPDLQWDFSNSLSEVNGATSTVHGDTQIVDIWDGPVTKAAEFDGSGDYIDCGSELNLPYQHTFSILLNCRNVDKNYSNFFAKYETNREGPYAFSIRQGYVNCWITEDASNDSYTEIESETRLQNNRWYVITIVKDYNDFRIYIDGTLSGEGSIYEINENNDSVLIGSQAFLFSPEEDLQFDGYIGSISIYNQALSEEQIEMIAEVTLGEE